MFMALFVALLLSAGWIGYAIRHSQHTAVRSVNPAGRVTALVVYHPGLSDYQREMTDEFVAGLVEQGWKVDVTTASSSAPRDLSPYRLLVIGGPVYWWAPARPVTRYLEGIGPLQGKPTAILLTGAGSVDRARELMEHQVQAAGGQIVASLALTIMRPNDEAAMRSGEKNRATAARMAREAARRIPLPAD
jgi:flavorubredoxin